MAIDQEIVCWIAERLGTVRDMRRLKSNNNLVYAVDLTSGERIVVKACSQDNDGMALAQEICLLRCLWDSGVPVPRLLDTHGSQWFAMERIEGSLLERCEAEWAWKAAREMPAQLAQLSDERLSKLLRPQRREWGLLRQRLHEHGMWRYPYRAIVERGQKFVSEEQMVPIHGDYGPGQFIVTHQGLVLLDLESLCLGDPLCPLGRCMAMVREYSHEWHWSALTTKRCLELLVEGYCRECPLSDSDRVQLIVHEMMSHLWDISWKLVCGPEHHQHALQMAQRIEHEWYPSSGHDIGV